MNMVKAEDNLNLVHYVLQKHFHKHPNSQDYEDYFQVGCVGLVKAAQNYNPEIGEFSTYAIHMIKGEIKRYIRDCLQPIRIPRGLREKVFKFASLSGRGLTEKEICVTLGIDERELAEIKKVYKAKTGILWLDAPIPNNKKKKDKESNFYELIPEETDMEEQVIENVTKDEIRQLLSQILSKRDYQMFCLINEGKTQEEIGRVYGISQVQVSRILLKIQREIAPAIRKYFDGDDSEIKRLIRAKQKKEKRRMIYHNHNKKLEVESMEDKKEPKKLTVEELENCLKRGMTEEQIAEEYAKNIKIVKMLIARLNNKKKPSKKGTHLEIISLKGLLKYEIDYERKMVFMRTNDNENGNAAIGVVLIEDIPKLIEELQELQRIVS